MHQQSSRHVRAFCTKYEAKIVLGKIFLENGLSLSLKHRVHSLSKQISRHSKDGLSIEALVSLLSLDCQEREFIHRRFHAYLSELGLPHRQIKQSTEPNSVISPNQVRTQKEFRLRLVEIILSRQLQAEECSSLNDLYRLLDNNLEAFLEAILNGEEFQSRNNLNHEPVLAHLSNSEFIVFSFIATLGRYPTPHELMIWSHEWLDSVYSRSEAFTAIQNSRDPLFLQNSLVLKTFGRNAIIGGAISHSSSPSATLMGTTDIVTIEDWERKKQLLAAVDVDTTEPAKIHCITSNIFTSTTISDPECPILSIITSLYNADEFIRPFLENIVNQVDFHLYELLIIDACSPGSEKLVVDEYVSKFSNIVYHRCTDRISIYEAWNLGVAISRGKYLTNANLDDLRAPNGLSTQVSALELFSGFDIAYGDFYYFFEPNPSWDLVEKVGIKSNLSHLSPEILLTQNYPHCAPVWRKSLHEEIGTFDVSYKSAADWEFWIRCIRQNKKFIYIPLALSGYYQNPAGISTSADTRGVEEVAEIYSSHFKDLVMKSDSPIMLSRHNLARVYPSSRQLPLRSHLLNSYIELQELNRLANPDKSFVSIQ